MCQMIDSDHGQHHTPMSFWANPLQHWTQIYHCEIGDSRRRSSIALLDLQLTKITWTPRASSQHKIGCPPWLDVLHNDMVCRQSLQFWNLRRGLQRTSKLPSALNPHSSNFLLNIS
ncbi:hypothetical protein KP509_18G084300 [Ceratopteris richardii]|uniref:Uncharacterized protein n=1 Tax=Ceratopteris richardii TaxID=49495 RepID=A0A8T2SV70_CERRI|nr:hypothetical protein KP509_18G084300 [Ceratopteris richardii]